MIALFLLIARVFVLRSYLRARRSRVAVAVLGPQLQEERTALLRRLFRAVGAANAAKRSRRLAPAPRYDNVFYEGVRALDEMDAPTLPPLEPGVYQRVDPPPNEEKPSQGPYREPPPREDDDGAPTATTSGGGSPGAENKAAVAAHRKRRKKNELEWWPVHEYEAQPPPLPTPSPAEMAKKKLGEARWELRCARSYLVSGTYLSGHSPVENDGPQGRLLSAHTHVDRALRHRDGARALRRGAS